MYDYEPDGPPRWFGCLLLLLLCLAAWGVIWAAVEMSYAKPVAVPHDQRKVEFNFTVYDEDGQPHVLHFQGTGTYREGAR